MRKYHSHKYLEKPTKSERFSPYVLKNIPAFNLLLKSLHSQIKDNTHALIIKSIFMQLNFTVVYEFSKTRIKSNSGLI